MPDLLLEVGLEEIPARMIDAAEAALIACVRRIVVDEKLLFAADLPRSYSSPRRIAVNFTSIYVAQLPFIEEINGPSWSVAFRNGEFSAAAHAFAKKVGVEVSELTKKVLPKGEYASAMVNRAGRSAKDILRERLPASLSGFYWPKSMYWRSGKPERFVRPVRWLLALLDHEIVPLEFAGVTAGNRSYGHRILYGGEAIEIAEPSAYLQKLEAAFVLPAVEARRRKIRKSLDVAARGVRGLRWREDHALVDTVTHLTEWPSVILGSFEREYLALPDEVLVTVMRDHQKYFALEDESGKLAPHFLAVLNTQSDEEGETIIRHGNERVLRARFNDARFFWNSDQKIPLTDRVEMLKSVTFHKDLGSYYDKTLANAALAADLAAKLPARNIRLDEGSLRQAALLAKADLTTELVKEFTELQGIVGGLYARAQNLGETVWRAIYSQYTPASAEDGIPKTVEGLVFGLADRIHTIVEMFAIGLEPTGSKDPFALRRAGNGIVRILAESALALRLGELTAAAVGRVERGDADTVAAKVDSFLRERLDFYLRETRGFSYDVVAATLAAGDDDIPDAIARAEVLSGVRGSEDFAAISAAFKRIKNILRQAGERGEFSPQAVAEVSEGLLTEPAEKALYAESARLAAIVEQLRGERKYREALEQIATLRPHVDYFFDKVMVMTPEAELRQNRLVLISTVFTQFSKIADFSEMVAS